MQLKLEACAFFKNPGKILFWGKEEHQSTKYNKGTYPGELPNEA